MTEGLVLYGAAAVLTAIVTALGFKIANNENADATINKMAEDLSKVVVPGVKIISGMSSAGLVPSLLYLYMQLSNGKTVVPQNLISWVQNWLSNNGAYDTGGIIMSVTPEQLVDKEFKISEFNSHKTDMTLEAACSAVGIPAPPSEVEFDNPYNTWNKKYCCFGWSYSYNCPAFSFANPISPSSTITFRSVSYTGYTAVTFDTPAGGIFYYKGNKWKSGSSSDRSLRIEQSNIDVKFVCNFQPYSQTSNDTGVEAGENVPGKDVLIPGEGTGDVTNEDIVGWLNSAVGQAVAEALGIGTEELQYVPVGVANPALTGEASDVLANSTTQDAVQTGDTAVDIVQSGNNTANVTFAQDSPISNVKASSLYTIWNPTQDQLNNLATFLWSTDFVDLIKKVLQSPMDAIISLALFPITPETDGTHVINLGYVPSGVSALRVSNQFQTFQTSGLVIPHKYNSYLDYSPYTTAEIYLPFIGFKSLNINDIMGKTVSVNYNIDMLSGTCTAIVKVDGNSMYSYSGNMALFLPLSAGNWARMMTSIFGAVGGVASIGAGVAGVMSGSALLGSTAAAVSGARTLGNLESNSVSRSGKISGNAGILGDYQPFIVITRPINDKPSTYNSNIGQTYNKSVQLGTLSGFTVVDEAHIEGMSATETEKKEIERLLKEGVIL